MKEQLPGFLVKLLRACPQAGEGVHGWLFGMARQLHWHMGREEMADTLERATANCGRVVTLREIMAAIQDSASCAWQPDGSGSQSIHAAPKWPVVNQEKREAVIVPGFGLGALREASPIRFDDSDVHTEEIIDRLFPGNPLLCCGQTNYDFDTRPREEWRGVLSTLQLIVPSPMCAITGKTQDGRESKHTKDNTGLRQNLAVEFDHGDRKSVV